jgi:hypothetical protein
LATANTEFVIMTGSILALPIILMFWPVTYHGLERQVRSPWLLALAVAGVLLGIFGGAMGRIGVALVVPYIQLLMFAGASALYRAVNGANLEQRPLRGFVYSGQFGLAAFDTLVIVAVLAVPFLMFTGYDAVAAGFSRR